MNTSVIKVGPGFCPEKRCRRQCAAAQQGGGGQPKAMLAVVLTDDTSLASPQAANLVRSVVRPLPTETASAGFRREPCYGRKLSPSVVNSRRFLKHGGNSWQISRWSCLPGRGGNSRQIVSCGLTRVDRVNPWRVDTFGTVQLDDALSVAAAQTGCNTDLS